MPDFRRRSSNGEDPSLDEVNRVDRFLDALGSRQTPYSTDHAEAELAFLLADWRDEIRDTPITVPVTSRDAATALREGLSHRTRGGRRSLALVGSVAAAVLCIGGFGAAVVGSGPGDPLYGMRTAIFGQEEVRDDQVSLASAQLAQVQQLVDQGQWQQAQDKLVELSSTVQAVDAPPQQKQDLIQQWNALSYKVVEQDAAAALPPAGEPLPALSNSPLTFLPVPAITTSTSTPTSTTTTSSSDAPTPTTTSATTTESSPQTATSTSSSSTSTATTPQPTTTTSSTTTTTVQPTTSTTVTSEPTTTTAITATTTTQPTSTTVSTSASTSVAIQAPSPTASQSELPTVSAVTPSQSTQERRPEPTTATSAAR